MIFNPARDIALAAELRDIRGAGGIPTLLLILDGEPVNVGLDGDDLAILLAERVTFDVAAGFRIEPPSEGAP